MKPFTCVIEMIEPHYQNQQLISTDIEDLLSDDLPKSLTTDISI